MNVGQSLSELEQNIPLYHKRQVWNFKTPWAIFDVSWSCVQINMWPWHEWMHEFQRFSLALMWGGVEVGRRRGQWFYCCQVVWTVLTPLKFQELAKMTEEAAPITMATSTHREMRQLLWDKIFPFPVATVGLSVFLFFWFCFCAYSPAHPPAYWPKLLAFEITHTWNEWRNCLHVQGCVYSLTGLWSCNKWWLSLLEHMSLHMNILRNPAASGTVKGESL